MVHIKHLEGGAITCSQKCTTNAIWHDPDLPYATTFHLFHTF